MFKGFNSHTNWHKVKKHYNLNIESSTEESSTLVEASMTDVETKGQLILLLLFGVFNSPKKVQKFDAFLT